MTDPSMAGPLSGRRALVTGAARGIGAACAKALAEAGAAVHLADVIPPDETAMEITDAGGQALATRCDVADPQSIEALFTAQRDAFGGLDIAVSAAGILTEARVTETSVEAFDRIVAVNLRGTFLIAREAARLMTQDGPPPPGMGRIITISSELAHLGRADFSAYCATKAGVVGLTKSLARELAPGILVNSVAPGPVDTAMLSLEAMSPEWREKETDIPLKRVGTVEEIAATVRFLAGPEATFFTGQTISPNGGAAMA